MSKSVDALCFSIDRLADWGVLYLWTFTFSDLLEVSEGRRRWQLACRELVAKLDYLGVRVYEMHESHGLHIHVVACGRYPVRLVRQIVTEYGFGRVHVQRVRSNPYYISKYVSKSHRDPALAGCRLWASFGKLPERIESVKLVHDDGSHTFENLIVSPGKCRTRVRDVEYDSLWHRAKGFVKHRLGVQGLPAVRLADFICGLAIEHDDDLKGDCKRVELAWVKYWAVFRWHGGRCPLGWKEKRWRKMLLACSRLTGAERSVIAGRGRGAPDNLVNKQTIPESVKRLWFPTEQERVA